MTTRQPKPPAEQVLSEVLRLGSSLADMATQQVEAISRELRQGATSPDEEAEVGESSSVRFGRLRRRLKKMLRTTSSKSFVMIRDGEVVTANALEAQRPDVARLESLLREQEQRLLYECRHLPVSAQLDQMAEQLLHLAGEIAPEAGPPAEEDIAAATAHMEAMSAALDDSRARLADITKSAERIRDLLSLPL